MEETPVQIVVGQLHPSSYGAAGDHSVTPSHGTISTSNNTTTPRVTTTESLLEATGSTTAYSPLSSFPGPCPYIIPPPALLSHKGSHPLGVLVFFLIGSRAPLPPQDTPSMHSMVPAPKKKTMEFSNIFPKSARSGGPASIRLSLLA